MKSCYDLAVSIACAKETYMVAQPHSYIDEATYLAAERASTSRNEYYAGVIYAMAGASEQHNLIASNILASLHTQLRGRAYRIYASDMRLKVLHTGLNTYPDLAIICGPPQFTDPTKRDTLTNPVVLVEILSPSTERYDRGLKFQHYRTIESLQIYVLVAQDRPYVEWYTRQGQHWLLNDASGLDATVELLTLAVPLKLHDVYAQVELAPGPAQLFSD